MSSVVQSNVEVVVYALEILGGASKKIASEDVAVLAHKLAPDRFSWIKKEYSDLADKYVVKTALEDAAKVKTGNLVSGNYARDESKDGWTLTPEGIRWLEENRDRVADGLSSSDKKPSLRPVEVKRLITRIKSSAAYKTYSKQGTIEAVNPYLFADLLQASPDAPSQILLTKMNRLLGLGEMIRDDEVLRFLKACKDEFSEILGISREV